MAAKKTVAKKVVEEEVVIASVAEAVEEAIKLVTVRFKKGNTFTVVDFTEAVQGKDFVGIAKQYARMMGGEIV